MVTKYPEMRNEELAALTILGVALLMTKREAPSPPTPPPPPPGPTPPPEVQVVEERWIYDDYASVSFDENKKSYRAGQNANTARPDALPWPPSAYPRETTFMSDQDCYIQFDYPNSVAHRIPADKPWVYRKKWTTVYIQRVTVNGTLEIWIEG
jgi:hypothetical protein